MSMTRRNLLQIAGATALLAATPGAGAASKLPIRPPRLQAGMKVRLVAPARPGRRNGGSGSADEFGADRILQRVR